MPLLPDSIRYSETIEASPTELIQAVREQRFRGHPRESARQSVRAGQALRAHRRKCASTKSAITSVVFARTDWTRTAR
jgi:hypothetical protein